jgi:serine/threonine protein kinase
VLHFFKLVHMDIKPQNIMLSPSSSEVVFIDFGFSQFLKEPVGLQSKTLFCGSLEYCSPEMKQLYVRNGDQMADLYFNDVYCLAKALEEIHSY